MLTLAFMRHAFVASTFIAIISGIVGVFVVARQLSFLTHTLSEIGFAGASFAVFAGLGILFLSLSSQSASSATSILFGSVVGISAGEVHQLILLSLAVFLVILIMYRQLKFSSFDAIGAQVSGTNQTVVSVVFLVLLALSVSVAAQIVGSLLIFILLTIPAASAKYFTHGVAKMVGLAIIFALLGTWTGLLLGYLTNWPVSFFIALIEVVIYVIALIYQNSVEAN